MTSKSVVVVGGSNAGIGVCHGLLKGLPGVKVTLINPSKEYYFNLASPRLLTKPDLLPENKYIYDIAEVFKRYPSDSFRFVQGKAREIDLQNRRVHLEQESEEPIAYDYLVIASGSTTPGTIGKQSFPAPFKAPVDGDLRSAIDKTRAAIKAAKTIVIGGGGPIGVEFSAEIVEAFERDDKKQVTLISGTEKVLAGIADSARNTAEQLLRNKGVELKTGCMIEKAEYNETDKQWTVTLQGETITADLFISAMGTLPNNAFIPPSLLNPQGWVNVNEHLQVRNDQGQIEQNVYALGDITHYLDRVLTRVVAQIPVAVANLKKDISGKGVQKSYLADKQNKMMAVPVGRNQGTGVYNNWKLCGWLVSFAKGKDFLTNKATSYIQG